MEKFDVDARGVFINGKEQIVELLKFLPEHERQKLITNMRARNPQKTQELCLQVMNMEDLLHMDHEHLHVALSYINPQVLGLALKGKKPTFQRELLSRCPRDYAEKTFAIMQANINDSVSKGQRAQRKVKDILISLRSKRLIQI